MSLLVASCWCDVAPTSPVISIGVIKNNRNHGEKKSKSRTTMWHNSCLTDRDQVNGE